MTADRLVLLPAVDVADGQAVRLVQGEAGSETAYGAPLDAALAWQGGGAEWVHLVDLDAAFGRGSNRELIAEVVGALDVAVELSGGTHVARTGDIALFKIVSEAGVAAGVRRIEALTGEPARRWLLDQAAVAKALAEQFKVPVAELTGRIDALQAERRALEKALSEAKRQLATGGGGGASAVEEIGGIKVIARVLDGVGGKERRGVAEDFKKQLGSGVVALVGTAEGKAAVTVAVSADLVGRFSAVDLARAAVSAMGGQGAGGKPDFAQGGAPDAAMAQVGLDAAKAAVASSVSGA